MTREDGAQCARAPQSGFSKLFCKLPTRSSDDINLIHSYPCVQSCRHDEKQFSRLPCRVLTASVLDGALDLQVLDYSMYFFGILYNELDPKHHRYGSLPAAGADGKLSLLEVAVAVLNFSVVPGIVVGDVLHWKMRCCFAAGQNCLLWVPRSSAAL